MPISSTSHSENDTLDYKLQLREETALYVPRFLAISKIMRNAETLGLQPSSPDDEHPVLLPVSPVSVRSATDLVELSRRLGMNWKEFQAYNPHFLRSISPAGRTSTAYVPRNKEALARRVLSGTVSGAGWRYYTVRRGDTYAKVSSRTGVPASVIRQLNPGSLKRGSQLRLPANGRNLPAVVPAAPSRDTAIASNSGRRTSVSASKGGDHASSALAELKGRRASVRSVPATYKVQSGDTLTAIARKYDMDLDDLYAANGGADKLDTLRVGRSFVFRARRRGVQVRARKALRAEPRLAHGAVRRNRLRHFAQVQHHLCRTCRRQRRRGGPRQSLSRPGAEDSRRKDHRRGAEQHASGLSRAACSDAGSRAKEREQHCEYSVQNGETLWSISRKFNMKPMELLALNGMDQSTRVKVGDTVKVIRNK